MKFRNPFKRQPVEFTALTINPLTVKHEVTYQPKPRPTLLTFTCYNNMGESYMLPPMQLVNGQYGPKIHMPLYHFTRRPEDNGVQISLDCCVDYDEMKSRY